MRSAIRSMVTRALVASVIAVAATTAAADPLNTSFETPIVTEYTPATTPTAWNGIPYTSYFTPWLDRDDPDYGTPPDGDQFGGPYSGIFWQNTGIMLEQDVKYTVTFWAKAYHGYTGNVEGQIWATTDQVSRGTWVAGTTETHPGVSAPWMQYTMTYACGSTMAGRWLVISVGDPTAAWTAYDAFRVDINIPTSNGSFETPVVTGYTTGSAPQTWNGVAYNGNFTPWLDTSSSAFGQAKDGNQYAGPYAGAFWQNTGIKMRNTFKYTVSFWAKAAHDYTNNIEAAIYAATNATNLGSQRAYLRATKTGGASAAWTLYSVSYTCDSANDGKFLVAYIGDPTGAWVAYDQVNVDAPQRNRYYWKEDKSDSLGATATYVYMAGATLNRGSRYVFETRNLSPGADTVMHLTQGTLVNEVAYNDDCPGAGLGSCIDFTPSSTGTYYLIIYAYSPNSGGRGGQHTFDLYVGGNLYSSGIHLGGYVIYSTQTSAESFETVLVSDGATATALARLDWNQTAGHYKPAAMDWTSGVGTASKLYGNGNSKWILATATPQTRPGPVRAIRNDVALHDTDGDGLGDLLEIEACTCPHREYGMLCGFSCNDAGAGAQDTDGDGLPDYWEMIGCESNASKVLTIPEQGHCPFWQNNYDKPQVLPKWGASPRHKDLFVEIDRSSDPVCPGEPFMKGDAEFVAARFAAVAGMNNPDGIDGIAAHFDIDEDTCSSGPDGISSVCGNFGGSQVVTTNCDVWAPASFDPVRLGIFHWAERDCNLGNAPIGGHTACFGTRRSLTHELGHNLGLNHHGADSAGQLNNKPHYPSVMNYSYQDARNKNEALTGFSDGSREPLDPTNLREDAAYSQGCDTSFMTGTTGEPYVFPEHGSPGSQLIDWNRDGIPDTGGVRAHVTQAPWSWDANDGYDHPIMQEIEDMPASNSVTAPAGARFSIGGSRWTYVVVNDQTTHLFKYTRSSQRTGGWEQIYPGQYYQDIGTTPHRADAQPSVVEFATWTGPRLVVFGSSPTTSAPWYATMDSYGQWSGWTSLSKPQGTEFREVSAAVLGNRTYVVARDNTAGTPAPENVYYGWLDSYLQFSGWFAVSTSLIANLKSSAYTPGLAAGPDGNLYMAVIGAARQNWLNRLAYYVFSPSTQTWSYLNLGWPNGEPGEDVKGRPSMLFRPYFNHQGQALPSGNGALHVWWPAWRKEPYGGTYAARPTYRWTWGQFSAATQNFTLGRWHQPRLYNALVCGDTSMNDNSGIGLMFRDAEVDMNLEAFMPHGPVANCGPGWHRPDTVHVPHADGEFLPTSGMPIADFNDYPVLGEHLCLSLRSESECTIGFSLGGPPQPQRSAEARMCRDQR
jgi:hypothetical protein